MRIAIGLVALLAATGCEASRRGCVRSNTSLVSGTVSLPSDANGVSGYGLGFAATTDGTWIDRASIHANGGGCSVELTLAYSESPMLDLRTSCQPGDAKG